MPTIVGIFNIYEQDEQDKFHAQLSWSDLFVVMYKLCVFSYTSAAL